MGWSWCLPVGEALDAVQALTENSIEILYLNNRKDPSYAGVFGFQDINELAALEMFNLVTADKIFSAVES